MTVYKRGQIFWYDFWFHGQRYRQSTLQLRRDDAARVEEHQKIRVRQRAAGLEPEGVESTPRFQDWAEAYYAYKRRRVRRPEVIERILRVVLRFFGAPTEKAASKRPGARHANLEGPRHDLRLGHVIEDAAWIERFEQWMDTRGIAPQTRNHYRSQLSQLYVVAMLPQFRKATHITTNPFAVIERDKTQGRTVTLSVDEIRTWLGKASYHVRLAIAIAALAPKLREQNVLGLRFDDHLDRELRWITVHEHKTDGEPLVVPIDDQLRTILQDARARQRGPFVVTYQSRRVRSIRAGVENACQRAKIPYGRARGVTFHTIRHSMATLLAELGEPEKIRAALLGHRRIATTQRYTHLRPVHEAPAHARLSAAVPIADVVIQPWKRAKNPKRA